MSMAKVASPTTAKRVSSPKNTAAPLKSRSRATKEVAAKEVTGGEVAELSPELVPEPSTDGLQLLTERFTALEEKIIISLSSLAAELQTLKSTPSTLSPDGTSTPESETFLPIVGDLIRRHLMEHLNPLVASLKRIEERVGFIGNCLKHAGPSQEQRPKPPWRHDQQQRHNNRPRTHNGQPPRPGQGPPWSPPNAASVQGHFAPRPLRGGEHDRVAEDDE